MSQMGMGGRERRAMIEEVLSQASAPVSGAALGRACGVSRQVVVQDIALLRGQGVGIVSTNRGYVLPAGARPRPTRVLKCHHTVEETLDEMDIVVDHGGWVEDVFVNHRAYGVISSRLDVHNRQDVRAFMDKIHSGVSSPLMDLTDGYHFHHVSADSADELDRIEAALRERGFLAEALPYERHLLEQ